MTRSIWYQSVVVPSRPTLTDHLTTDVCVVGAGIAGLSVAYTLARSGKRVVVLDLAQVGAGETGHTTAHLSNALDDRYYMLEKAHDAAAAHLAAESHTAAIDRIEQTVREEQIECDFARVDGYLFLGGDDASDVLLREQEAARRAGLDVSVVASAPGFASGAALRFPRQGRFHVLKYVTGLADAIERHGGKIFGESKVEKIEGGSPAMVTTADGLTVAADDVVVCTNGAISDMVVTHAKQAPYRSFVVALAVERGSVPDALYWDTPDPYHYVRIQPMDDGRDALIVGGEDVKNAHEDDAGDRFTSLERWARARWPQAGERVAQWTGMVNEPVDYLAFIGANPDGAKHVWLATGDSGMGMTHGTIAGILLPALIAGKEHPWKALYDPKRVALHPTELLALARENADNAFHLAQNFLPGDVRSSDDVPLGEGRVILRGMHKVAVYRDDSGTVHECSAVCTHMKCIVGWNTAEKSWDCPCHGSRFDAYGKVIAGPAITDLEKAS